MKSSPASDQPDQKLLDAWKNGDMQAFKRLFTRYYKMAGYYSYSFVKDKNENKDIVHQVFEKLESLPEEKVSGISNFKSYLCRCIRNKYLENQRQRSNHRRLNGNINTTKPKATNGHMPDLMASDALNQGLKLLTNSQRECVELYQAGYTNEEIAQKTGKPSDAVRGLLYRGRAKLIDKLNLK